MNATSSYKARTVEGTDLLSIMRDEHAAANIVERSIFQEITKRIAVSRETSHA